MQSGLLRTEVTNIHFSPSEYVHFRCILHFLFGKQREIWWKRCWLYFRRKRKDDLLTCVHIPCMHWSLHICCLKKVPEYYMPEVPAKRGIFPEVQAKCFAWIYAWSSGKNETFPWTSGTFFAWISCLKFREICHFCLKFRAQIWALNPCLNAWMLVVCGHECIFFVLWSSEFDL